jgi:putative restriction endonuclease
MPMFGGATSYVATLDVILEFVESHNPTTDELVW